MISVEERLKELGIELPEVAKPVAAYVPAMEAGEIVMTSGQLPMRSGRLEVTGAVGEGGLNTEQAAAEARQACLNALAAIRAVLGDLDRVERVMRVGVFVSSKPDFYDQPKVANGASLLLDEIFGDEGKHVRAAVGCVSLPLNAAVEVELSVQVKRY